MDNISDFKRVNNLNDYITLTNEIRKKIELSSNNDSGTKLDLTTVKFLQKIRQFEIQFFIKFKQNGAAFLIFDNILRSPPSASWATLGEYLVDPLQYWLEELRLLITQPTPWWIFLKGILGIIQNLPVKHQIICEMLVQDTTKCLLELASNDVLNLNQKLAVLKCFNKLAAFSTRRIRQKVAEQCHDSFLKLSHYMGTCGHMGVQMTIMETLLRLFINRHDPGCRALFIKKFLPKNIYSDIVLDIFLVNCFKEYNKDARNFLMAQNECTGLVLSVKCAKMTIGSVDHISREVCNMFWLDINIGTECITVSLDDDIRSSLGIDTMDFLTIKETNTKSINIFSEFTATSFNVVMEIVTVNPPEFFYESSSRILNDTDRCLRLYLEGVNEIADIDKALSKVFKNKYMGIPEDLLNRTKKIDCTKDDSMKKLSLVIPEDLLNRSKNMDCAKDDSMKKLSLVKENNNNRRPSGVAVKSQFLLAVTPSSTSTTSLLALPEKLKALPNYTRTNKFRQNSEKKLPSLPRVPEISESNDTFDPYVAIERNDLKDGVDYIQQNYCNIRRISPVIFDNDTSSNSCLVAASKSVDDTSINIPIESETKLDVNLVEKLLNEAFSDKDGTEKEVLNKKSQRNEPVKSTEVSVSTKKLSLKKACTVISSTSYESTTDVINDTPLDYVNMRKRKNIGKRYGDSVTFRKTVFSDKEALTADPAVIKDIFSVQKNRSHVVISPSVARRINQTSSEFSDDGEEPKVDSLPNKKVEGISEQLLIDEEAVDCLNSVLNQVHSSVNQEVPKDVEVNNVVANVPIASVEGNNFNIEKIVNNAKGVTLKFQNTHSTTKKQTKRKATMNAKKKNVANKKNSKKIDSKNEKYNNTTLEKVASNSKISDLDTEEDDIPLIVCKKRKLYSPKNEESIKLLESVAAESELNLKTKRKSSNAAMCYKEIQKVRQTRTVMKTRKAKAAEEQLSPRTLKNNETFDKLRESIIMTAGKTTLANKLNGSRPTVYNIGVYNLTSDSEPEFVDEPQIKKNLAFTRQSKPPSAINKAEKNKKGSNKKPPAKMKRVAKKTKPKSPKINIEKIPLEDEKMRDAASGENMNNSIGIVEDDNEDHLPEPSPRTHIFPIVEVISAPKYNDVSFEDNEPKNTKVDKIVKEVNMEVSPLPGLLIEKEITSRVPAHECTMTSDMIVAFQDIYEENNIEDYNEERQVANEISVNFSPRLYDFSEKRKSIKVSQEVEMVTVEEDDVQMGEGENEVGVDNISMVSLNEGVNCETDTSSEIYHTETYKNIPFGKPVGLSLSQPVRINKKRKRLRLSDLTDNLNREDIEKCSNTNAKSDLLFDKHNLSLNISPIKPFEGTVSKLSSDAESTRSNSMHSFGNTHCNVRKSFEKRSRTSTPQRDVKEITRDSSQKSNLSSTIYLRDLFGRNDTSENRENVPENTLEELMEKSTRTLAETILNVNRSFDVNLSNISENLDYMRSCRVSMRSEFVKETVERLDKLELSYQKMEEQFLEKCVKEKNYLCQKNFEKLRVSVVLLQKDREAVARFLAQKKL